MGRISGSCSGVHWRENAAFSVSSLVSSSFTNTSASLPVIAHSDEGAMRRCLASVHSTNATWQTSFGLTRRHSDIFSAVMVSPHREARVSGRFANGHFAVRRDSRVGKISSRTRGTKPLSHPHQRTSVFSETPLCSVDRKTKFRLPERGKGKVWLRPKHPTKPPRLNSFRVTGTERMSNHPQCDPIYSPIA
jgi:hypothetical protein